MFHLFPIVRVTCFDWFLDYVAHAFRMPSFFCFCLWIVGFVSFFIDFMGFSWYHIYLEAAVWDLGYLEMRGCSVVLVYICQSLCVCLWLNDCLLI